MSSIDHIRIFFQSKAGIRVWNLSVKRVSVEEAAKYCDNLYSTLSPCDMCSGTALLYKIPKIIISENKTFQGPEDYLRSRGVELEILNNPECIKLMEDFIKEKPELWNEDIGD